MKKKLCFIRLWEITGHIKLLRVMKLTVFLILVSVAGVFASKSYSQTKTLNLNMREATVKEVLNKIEEQSEFYFLFSENLIDVQRRVNVNIQNQKIEQALNLIFDGTDVDYSIRERIIVLKTPELSDMDFMTQQQSTVSGKITDEEGEPLPGVTVIVKGTTQGTVTSANGEYAIDDIPEDAILQFSFLGMRPQEIVVGNQAVISVVMVEETVGMDEIVVIGYGTQKKSDITGSVASLPQDRLEMVPNTNITQALQGAVAGIQITTNSAGASPENDATSILIRGRNSIKADNGPLVVVDGIPYGGQLSDIAPTDIKSIEILKDASSTAIYGSRGANGVILITTKLGKKGKPQISYDGYYSIQKMTNFPDLMTGEEFYKYKMEREPDAMTEGEQQVYDNGTWTDWPALALRHGESNQHNIAIAGGAEFVNYYVSVNVLDVKGIALNDDYLRVTNRINIDAKITDWLSLGTRTSISYADQSGDSPDFDAVTYMNPLTTSHNEDGSLTIYPNPSDTYFGNPLQNTLAQNQDKSHQVITNNFAKIDFPFIPGLQYQLNTGFRFKYSDYASYFGRDTKTGITNRGDARTDRAKYLNQTIENILSYNRQFGKHNVFATALYSFEKNESSNNRLDASGFPHDILGWFAAGQATLITPSYGYSQTDLLSQMLRINYGYDNRYLFTATIRRDGYSGFGTKTKWGEFPSLALGWNIANEDFFTMTGVINNLKLRMSWGKNGNQSVGAYETISRLSSEDWVSGSETQPGYIPSKLGEDNLGWESTETYNVGIDFGLFADRITGEINAYRANTTGLLLNRRISPIHGVDQITQNIGKTQNQGFEFSVSSTNINRNDFKWSTNANFSSNQNKIVSLYGLLSEEGNEIDDISNKWFIGEPIRVNYYYQVIGIWQQEEEEEAAKYGSKPGYVKLWDKNTDYKMDSEDRVIQGQKDPKFIWGMANNFQYKNFLLNVFIHGVHGVTKANDLKNDDVWTEVRRNTTIKNWWTPENPTNEFYKNERFAEQQGSGNAIYYENASFIRIKDISLAYDLPDALLSKAKLNKLRLFVTGRNLFTITNFGGLDPELSGQRGIPLQKEYVVGLNIGL
ncbi:MAG: TonB-dependent receptor [Cyclobacteriaceae bacterium]|nr:TonB-dependent receptor [Cyclobacteriaceae bacterium]